MTGRPAYSLIRHLGWALWLNHDAAAVCLGVFREIGGYYDASGSEGDPTGAVVCLGLLSTEKKWLRFETAWNGALAYGGIPYFHMKEFLGPREPFASLRKDESRCPTFMAMLIKAVKQNVNKIVLGVVMIDDFREVDRLYELRESFGGPYGYAAGSALGQANKWLNKKHPGMPVRHIFESGDAGWGQFQHAATRQGLFPIPQPKQDPTTGKWFSPFQAADLIGWEYRRRAIDRLGPVEQEKPIRASFQVINRMLPTRGGMIYEKNGLTAMCEEKPANYPRRAP